MPSKRSEDALIERQRVAESYGYQFEFRGQTEGFATIKMSLNTVEGIILLKIRDSHFQLRKPTEKEYTRYSNEQFESVLESIFETYKITERDQRKEAPSSNVKKVA